MTTWNIDLYLNKLEKNILLVEKFTELRELYTVIKFCRLKPLEFLETNNYKIKLFNTWVDEFGNSICIRKNKKIETTLNNISAFKYKKTTDLYYGISLEKINKISKNSLIIKYIDEDDNENFLLSFLCIDNYIRSYHIDGEICEQISPLYAGINNLRKFAKNLHIQSHKKMIIKGFKIPCKRVSGWISSVPFEDSFIKELEKNCIILANILKENNGKK